jgi:hypothetical protein
MTTDHAIDHRARRAAKRRPNRPQETRRVSAYRASPTPWWPGSALTSQKERPPKWGNKSALHPSGQRTDHK